MNCDWPHAKNEGKSEKKHKCQMDYDSSVKKPSPFFPCVWSGFSLEPNINLKFDILALAAHSLSIKPNMLEFYWGVPSKNTTEKLQLI